MVMVDGFDRCVVVLNKVPQKLIDYAFRHGLWRMGMTWAGAFISNALRRHHESHVRVLQSSSTVQISCGIVDEHPLARRAPNFCRTCKNWSRLRSATMAEADRTYPCSSPIFAGDTHSRLAETFDSLLDLLRRLPPTRIESNVNILCDLCPEYADDLLGNVDQPLKMLRDDEKGREFLGCDYNRDGDSFR